MRRNLIRYLPDILKRNLDFRILMEVQEKYGLQPVWEAAQAVLDDQFITTSDEYGIARFEGILGLKPDEDDTLEDRRKAVLMAWRRNTHIGLPELQKTADIWAPGWTELEYVHPLMLFIWMTDNAPYGPINIKSLWRTLRELAPANVGLEIAWRYRKIKELHRAVSVAELNALPLKEFAGGSGMPDRTRGTGILDFGLTIIVRQTSRIRVEDQWYRLRIHSGGPDYEAPELTPIGDGLWEAGGVLTMAADGNVNVRDDKKTLYITSKEG